MARKRTLTAKSRKSTHRSKSAALSPAMVIAEKLLVRLRTNKQLYFEVFFFHSYIIFITTELKIIQSN
jgi:hypothetical protein